MNRYSVAVEQGHSCVYRVDAEDWEGARDAAMKRWVCAEFYVEGAEYQSLRTRVTKIELLGDVQEAEKP